MNIENENCIMLTSLRDQLDARGVPSMRGDGIGRQTTKIYVISEYSNAVSALIMSRNYPADIMHITEDICVITATPQPTHNQ